MSEITQAFPVQEQALASALDYIEARGRDLRLPGALSLKLRLIVEELFTNTLRHAPADDSVRLGLACDGRQLRLSYEDGGPEYNPFAKLDHGQLDQPVPDRPVGRLGLVLIDGMAEAVSYERRGGRNCIRVVLEQAEL